MGYLMALREDGLFPTGSPPFRLISPLEQICQKKRQPARRFALFALATTAAVRAVVSWESSCFQFPEGHLAQNQSADIRVLAGILDINANQPAVLVKIKHNAIRNLIAVFALVFVQMDVQRIRFWIIRESHGVNLLSGNAL